MSEIDSGKPVLALVAALQAAVRALELGEIDAAAAAVVDMTAACEQAARVGAVFPPDQLAQARALHARLEALATVRQAAVVAEVLQTSTQRKATDAYGSGQ